MLNFSTRLGSNSKLSFNNTFTRGGDNEATIVGGFDEEASSVQQTTRLGFVSRTVRSDQIAGQHLLGLRHSISWQVTNAGVRRYEPDRSDYVQEGVMGADSLVTAGAWSDQIARSAYRSFSDLHEHGWNLGLDYRLGLSEAPGGAALKIGTNYRTADRDVRSEAYNIGNLDLSPAERAQAPGAIFSDANFAALRFQLQPDNQVGDYTARDRILSGYGLLELPLGGHLQLVTGARVEKADLLVTTQKLGVAPEDAALNDVDVLPSLALNFRVTADQNLRLSASQTLSRPEYRELSDAYFRGIASEYDEHGNPYLKRALIQNLDARWEFYPRAGEVLSVGMFYKHFDHPIEKVILASTGASALTFVNARAGRNYGVELEVRKGLDFLGERFRPFTIFSNLTLMRSRVYFDSTQNLSANSSDRPMLGQAPSVVNAGLTWNTATGWSATTLYNVVGRRLTEGGSIDLPDAYEEAHGLLDFSLRAPVVRNLELKFDAKNLLDPATRVTQGRTADGKPLERVHYTSGRVFQFGMTYRR
jgi:TonB-dependent receptor